MSLSHVPCSMNESHPGLLPGSWVIVGFCIVEVEEGHLYSSSSMHEGTKGKAKSPECPGSSEYLVAV